MRSRGTIRINGSLEQQHRGSPWLCDARGEQGGLHFWKNPWPGQHSHRGCVGRLFEAVSSRGWFLYGALPTKTKPLTPSFKHGPSRAQQHKEKGYLRDNLGAANSLSPCCSRNGRQIEREDAEGACFPQRNTASGAGMAPGEQQRSRAPGQEEAGAITLGFLGFFWQTLSSAAPDVDLLVLP